MNKSYPTAWTRYLIAASGTALAASTASAAIVYRNPAVDQQADLGQFFSFDMLTGTVTVSGDTTDSAFRVNNLGNDYITLVSTNSLNDPVIGGDQMSRLSVGAEIGGSSAFGGSASVYFEYNNSFDFPWNTEADGTTGYVGLRFAISGNVHYGWAQFTYNDISNNIILHDFAYEDVANTAIFAGDTGVIPEPGSAALFAALAAGSIATYRRRRSAVAA